MIDFSSLTNDQLVDLARLIAEEAHRRGDEVMGAYTKVLVSEAEKAQIERDAAARVAEKARAEEEARIREAAEAAARVTTAKQQGRATITVVGDNLVVASPYNEDFVAAVKDLGGKYDGTTRNWIIPIAQDYPVRHLCHIHYGCPAPVATGVTVQYTAYPGPVEGGRSTFRRRVFGTTGRLGWGVKIVNGSFVDRGSRKHSNYWLQHKDGRDCLLPVRFQIDNVDLEAIRKRLTDEDAAKLETHISVLQGDVPADMVEMLRAEEARGGAMDAAAEKAEAARLAKVEEARLAEIARLEQIRVETAEREAREAREAAERQEKLTALLGGVVVMMKYDSEQKVHLVFRNEAGQHGVAAVKISRTNGDHGSIEISNVLCAAGDAWSPELTAMFDTYEREQLRVDSESRDLVVFTRDQVINAYDHYASNKSYVCKQSNYKNSLEHRFLTPEQEAAEAARKAVTA